MNKQLDGKDGVYCENVDIARAVPADNPPVPGVKSWATNADYAEQLWHLSEDLIGIKFPV